MERKGVLLGVHNNFLYYSFFFFCIILLIQPKEGKKFPTLPKEEK